MSLSEKLKNHEARVGVIGLGYVGLPLVVEMAEAGFDVVGIDSGGTKTVGLLADSWSSSRARHIRARPTN